MHFELLKTNKGRLCNFLEKGQNIQILIKKQIETLNTRHCSQVLYAICTCLNLLIDYLEMQNLRDFLNKICQSN